MAGEQRLDPALVEAMARPLRRFPPELPPVLHGFYRMDHGGEVIHGGREWGHADLHLRREHPLFAGLGPVEQVW